ncbi:MAG: hypothetical protein Q4C34_01880 [Bacteroidales bacterium]|uniref:hypothetical protein n=1 Tax=Muribaculum intestinale TaxID=1796646 RepID=UPI0026F3DD25|nr:hypothetical protein [Muribaculum intestinale]MDO4319301.1 hypothetical protein [Bacteroidales bacterium]
MNAPSNNRKNKYWLVFANAKRCNHYASLVETGFISWKKARNNFTIGDIVYVFSSAERKIIFKTEVIGIEERADSKYWIEKAPKDITWRLRAIQEYKGDALDEDSLMQHGFKGGRSLQHPMCNNPELFEYIEEQFDN